MYVPRQTNLRIYSKGSVYIRGAIASAYIETEKGDIKLESPASQDAELVLSTRDGVIQSSLHVTTYGQATVKHLQGKLGNGGNPVIGRTLEGNILLLPLENELDRDVATIPARDPNFDRPYSSQPSYRHDQGGYQDYYSNPSPSSAPRSLSSSPSSTPYTYGGSYGSNNSITDVFSNNKDLSDDSSNRTGISSGTRQSDDKTTNSLGFGVRIIPPPSDTSPSNSSDTIYHDRPRGTPNLTPRSTSPSRGVNSNGAPTDPLFAGTTPRSTGTSTARSSTQPLFDSQPSLDDSDGETIKIDTNLVTLNVSVTDRSGRPVSDLRAEEFHIYEDGVEQTIAHFEPVSTPFNLILLVDLSGSIIDKIDILRRAITRFINITRPEDKIAIVTFTRTVQVVSELTNNRELLRQRLQYMHMPKGGTAFYEALWFTVTQIAKPVEHERTAIVIMSDGVDNSISINYPLPSRVTFDEVYRKLQESSVIVFSIYLDTELEVVSQQIEAPESYVLARKQLKALAEATAGVYIPAERVEHLEGVYEKIAADLRTLYSIGYYPTNSSKDGTWRKLKLKVDRKDLAVRTRKGYFAR